MLTYQPLKRGRDLVGLLPVGEIRWDQPSELMLPERENPTGEQIITDIHAALCEYELPISFSPSSDLSYLCSHEGSPRPVSSREACSDHTAFPLRLTGSGRSPGTADKESKDCGDRSG